MLSILASVNIAILLYVIMVPMSYLVGHIPNKKFKKDVKDYCKSQYEMMKVIISSPPPSQQQSKIYLSPLVNIGTLKNIRRVEKCKKNSKKDYYREEVIEFDSSSSSSDDDDDEDDDKMKNKELREAEKKREAAEFIASLRVYKMRGNTRVDVLTNINEDMKYDEKRKKTVNGGGGGDNKSIKDNFAELGIGKISHTVNL